MAETMGETIGETMQPLRERPAEPRDYAAWVELWRTLEVGATPPTEAHWRAQHLPATLVLVDAADAAVAYAMVFPLGARGDVRQIAVAPAWRRRGVGRQVMAAARARLRAAGCRDWRLEVNVENAGAIALYAACGLRVRHEIRAVVMERAALLARADASMAAAALAPADDAALEAAHDLGAGELARWRTLRPETALWHVRDAAGASAGFARYCRVHEPGCALLFPLRAVSVGAVARLVAAAQLAPLPERLELIALPALADALVAAGARVHERHLEMAGEL